MIICVFSWRCPCQTLVLHLQLACWLAHIGTIVCLNERRVYINGRDGSQQKGIKGISASSLTSKLLLPVAGDLAALGLDGLLAVGPCARSFPGAESTVPFVGYADTPLPLPAVRLALLLSCRVKHTPALCKLTFSSFPGVWPVTTPSTLVLIAEKRSWIFSHRILNLAG